MSASFTLGSDGIYRCADFQHFIWQAHGFGTRQSNPPADVTLRQVHSASVWNAHGLTDRQHEGDALITNDVRRRVGVRTADCLPILLLDVRHHAVAAVHAGWRGTVAGIAQRAVEKMTADFGSHSSDIYAAFGPCIRECCYEVGPEVAAQFVPLFPEWPVVTGKRHLDLVEANRRYLRAAGVAVTRVFDCGLCTVCTPEQFFSFRREPQNPGRMLSSIETLEA